MTPGEGVNCCKVVDSQQWIPTRRKFHIGRCFGVSDLLGFRYGGEHKEEKCVLFLNES